MYIKTKGLVLRETEYKESSRILTVLTSTEGKITVSAKGAKRRGSRTAAASQLLSYSEMTLFARGDRYVLTEASGIELFQGLRDDLSNMALASYFAQLLEAVTDADIQEPQMLSLGLNSLYALSRGISSRDIVKAAFELRLMCLAGFEPQLEMCSVCGNRNMNGGLLSLTGGTMRCSGCGHSGPDQEAELTGPVLDAMRYILTCDIKRLFSFRISQGAGTQLSRVCEAYLLCQLGRGFSALDFYKALNI